MGNSLDSLMVAFLLAMHRIANAYIVFSRHVSAAKTLVPIEGHMGNAASAKGKKRGHNVSDHVSDHDGCGPCFH